MRAMSELSVPNVDASFAAAVHKKQEVHSAMVGRIVQACSLQRTALDLGAYVGECSQILAQNFLRVISFEPHRGAFECLKRNSERFSNIEPVRLAIGPEKGVQFLSQASKNKFGHFQLFKKSQPEGSRTTVFSIDDLKLQDVDLIRVSSFPEWQKALAGASDTIARFRPALWLPDAEPVGDPDFLLSLGALGYRRVGQGNLYSATAAVPPTIDHADAVIWQDDKRKWLVFRTGTDDTESETYFGALVDRLYTPTIRRTGRSNRGASDIFVVSVPNSFNLDTKHRVTLPSQKVVPIPPTAGNLINLAGSDDLITATIRPGRVQLKLHWSAAARFSHVLIDTETVEQGRKPLAKVPLQSLANSESLEITFPDELLRPGETTLYVTPYGKDLEPSSIVGRIDTPRAKVSSATARCYLNHGGGGNDVIRAMADGLGCPLGYAEDGLRSGVPIVWGVLRGSREVIAAADAVGRLWIYIDHAYFARGHRANYRIALNRFEAGPVRTCPGDRLGQLGVQLQPWKRDGRDILVCPPTQHFMNAHGVGSWLDDTLAELARHTDRPIVVRQKPAPGDTPIPLAEAFESAYAVVTHSSNVAIEAVVAGVPVFVSPTSAAAPVGRTTLSAIERRSFPDRQQWLQHLAYSQFTFDEIKTGRALDLLLHHEEMPFVVDGVQAA